MKKQGSRHKSCNSDHGVPYQIFAHTVMQSEHSVAKNIYCVQL
jgi:hypothetical protein